jgi:hypothetical protein
LRPRLEAERTFAIRAKTEVSLLVILRSIATPNRGMGVDRGHSARTWPGPLLPREQGWANFSCSG